MTPLDADPRALREEDFPRRGSRWDQLRFVLRYAILAPSNRNTQPWFFTLGRDQISIHAELSRWQPVSDPQQRELRISIGCALENLLIALQHFGFGHHVTLCPGARDASILVQVAVLDNVESLPVRPPGLFGAIVRRRTHHGRYRARAIGASALRRLQQCNIDTDLRLLLTQSVSIKRAAHELMLTGEALGLADAKYREELAECIGAGNFGAPWLLAVAQQFAVAHLGARLADPRGARRSLQRSPVFGLISGSTGTGDAQIRAGQLLERLYLTATLQGLSLQPVSQLLEFDRVKAGFSRLFRAGGEPIVPFRLGYADASGHLTPRLPLEEVMR
jgi:nitroreductase